MLLPGAVAEEVPARLLPQLHPRAVLIDLRTVLENASREECNYFVLRALAVPAAHVSGIFVMRDTQEWCPMGTDGWPASPWLGHLGHCGQGAHLWGA